MNTSQSGRGLPSGTIQQRNPCDCNCVLFNNNQPTAYDKRYVFKLEDEDRLAVEQEQFSPDRASSSVETLKKKISVAELTKRRESKKNSRRHQHDQSKLHQGSESKVLMELLERPAESIRVGPPHVQQPQHPQRLNQTYEAPRTVIVVNQPSQYHEEPSRGFSRKPSAFDKSVTSTSYPYRTTEGFASTNKSASRQELFNSFMGRQLQTNSFVHQPRPLGSHRSLAQSIDSQRISEYSSHQLYRLVPQIPTSQVPETVPEELTSRSNTIVVPPIPLRQIEERQERLASKQREEPIIDLMEQLELQGSHTQHQTTKPANQGPQSHRPTVHLSARQSVGANNFLRQAQSILNYSPPHDHPSEGLFQPRQPMRFKKIESVGDDIEAERDDDCSEVLGHYSPTLQMPIRRLVRMSEAPAEKQASHQQTFSDATTSKVQVQSFSSRSRYEHVNRSLAMIGRGTAVTDRVHPQHDQLP